MRAVPIVILVVAVAAVATGVLIKGTAEHPAALFLPYMFATGVLELARKRPDTWIKLGLVPIVLGCSAAGVGATLGAEHLASFASALVWVGIAVAIAASEEAAATKVRGTKHD